MYPPFPLRVFGYDDFPLSGGKGYPPIPLKSRYFRSETLFLPLFIFFSPFWSIIWSQVPLGYFILEMCTKDMENAAKREEYDAKISMLCEASYLHK